MSRAWAIMFVALARVASADTPDEPRVGSVTAEAGIGAGYAFNTCTDQTGCPPNDVAPFTVAGAIGEWFTSSSALELRLADAFEQRPTNTFMLAFVGPAIQQRIGTRVWIGGGIGIAIAHGTKTAVVFSFDVRAGVLLSTEGHHSWNVSIEAAPAISGGDTSTPVSLLLGYQYL